MSGVHSTDRNITQITLYIIIIIIIATTIFTIYVASHEREFTVVPLGQSRSAPGGRQLAGQAANLTSESACIGCYLPNIHPSPCIIIQP